MLFTKQNLIRRLFLKIASEIFKIAKPIDAYLISKTDISNNIEYPPVFIIGAPRTGSTLIYQVLTNYFDVNYISNFSASYYHSFYVGMIIADKVLGNSPHNLFDSHYGMARSPKGPNECGQFWYRWFPSDRHFIASHEVSYQDLIGLRKTIKAIEKRFSKPIVFKNLNNGQRLQAINKILPESLFVFVKRDPVFTAQSILAGRQDFYGDKNAWFSVMPKNKDDLEKLDYPEQVVKQIYYLEKQIVEDLKLFPAMQSIVVQYETFCQKTEEELERLHQFFINNSVPVEKRDNVMLPHFQIDKQILVSQKDYELIKKECEKLAW